MPHPLVLQLRFARSEFKRALRGVKDEDARQRIMPMNCISWNVGHPAWQEQRYWLNLRGIVLLPQLNTDYAFGAPACTPPLKEVWKAWRTVTEAADPWLDTLDSEQLAAPVIVDGKPTGRTYGTLMLRTTYHYWYHTGENMAVRQMLGHSRLPFFVGNIDSEAPYKPEA
ncbi:MAG: DinB family protein [Chloroflexia bacterium]